MRLVKQSFLYFKEGNSDKVYEIDLCDAGNEKYVVNFRYGRRGSLLKEGSKTPIPVALAEAEKIFYAVEAEKIHKGYTTSESGEPGISRTTSFALDNSNVVINNDWTLLTPGRNKAILQRLHNAISGAAAKERFSWKLSRVIWKAGEYQIKEAAPYIIKLFDNGDQLHQYCCVWSLVRCEGDNAILQSIHNSHHSPAIAKLAGAGLVKNLTGLEKESLLQHYTKRLPEIFKPVVESTDAISFEQLLQERITQQQPNYNWLEDIYLIAFEKRWMRKGLKNVLLKIPLRPNYFKHVRAIFKMAEMLDDFEIVGLLSCRFERETEMFSHSFSLSVDVNAEIYVPEIEEWVKLQKELKKTTSRLAYSQKTRWYFHSRVLRRLRLTGKTEDINYVKLATALLIGYKYKEDFKEHYSTFNHVWKRNRYERIETRFIQNAHAVFLHQLLSGNNPELLLQSNRLWRIRSGEEKNKPSVNRSSGNSAVTNNEGIGGFIKKLTGLFSKKKDPVLNNEPAQNINLQPSVPNKNGTPYLHLWNKMPQAYVQLLMDAEMEEVHQFAEENLSIHPEFENIKARFDKEALKKLLSSSFAIPAKFGYSLAVEKYNTSIPDYDLVTVLLNCINTEAQSKGIQWAEAYKQEYLKESNFITSLIFAKHPAVRSWAKNYLKNNRLHDDIKNAVVGKSIAELLKHKETSTENKALLKDADTLLFSLFDQELKQLNIQVIADLLQHENPVVLLFGLQVLKTQKSQLDLQGLSKEFLFSLLGHHYPLVREEGIGFLNNLDIKNLLQYQDEIIAACVSEYENVRKGVHQIIERAAGAENAFGIKAAETLMPVLLRKETTEGIHADVSKLLCNELSGYLQNANRQTALNLLYSTYAAAQNVGVMILEKYTEPSQLTIPQVIALGAHENLSVREWCWKYYKEQSARIKYEKDNSIKLLESKWQDTRQFAMKYFREEFTEGDWTPDVLISLADSVKPDVEAFGRELITRFFTNTSGELYLLKLSQHPSEKMQRFATNYLERFATGDPTKIASLNFYLRSVLTRVNKSRTAKNRIYQFLLSEGRKSEVSAKIVSEILSDISAIAAIGDKAKCIDILMQLKALYDVATPLKVIEAEVRQ